MQFRPGCMPNLHELDVAGRECMMRRDLLGRGINRLYIITIMIFDDIEVLQEGAGYSSRPIPTADMDGLHIRVAIELYSARTSRNPVIADAKYLNSSAV